MNAIETARANLVNLCGCVETWDPATHNYKPAIDEARAAAEAPRTLAPVTSAAPDLLAACERALLSLRRKAWTADVEDALSAAIAKAKAVGVEPTPVEARAWCEFSLGFADGSDGDTVLNVLAIKEGWTVNVSGQDVKVVDVEQQEEEPYEMFLTGYTLDANDDPTEILVKLALNGARVVVY